MEKKRLFFFAILVVILTGTFAFEAHAQKMGDQLLAGLTTVCLRIQYYDDSGSKATGTESNQLVSETERQLTDAGLKVVSSSEFDRLIASRGYPIALLDIEVRIAKVRDLDVKIYNLSVRLRQLSYIARMPTLRFLGGTWDVTDYGTLEDFSFVKQRLNAVISGLIIDYKSENPK